ncbi:GNAT family N-acetyltransferase [Streptomyces sp. NPDC047081]|uniref:GNAT family N-acetyltransferase n=1 Tax=Streptomyces sp. NPDC047081 TaxID=3154706 RepID=UPI0033D80D89
MTGGEGGLGGRRPGGAGWTAGGCGPGGQWPRGAVDGRGREPGWTAGERGCELDAGHLVWAEQRRADGRVGPGVRVFRRGAAVAVASPGLSGRDRVAVAGEEEDALGLVADVLREVGPTYRPFGDAELIGALVRGIPGLEVGGGPFLWMETAEIPATDTAGARWLDGRGEAEAAGLFDGHFAGSYAQPGRPGVRRWAGVYGEDALLAVAADAWSGAGCGFMAGVVAHPRARGRGLGAAVSGFVVDALVREHGRAALMVDADNAPAIAAYERTGMKGRRFAAAGVARR